MSIEVYAAYQNAASDTHPSGYVVNNVLADSLETITLAAGQGAVADPDRKYPIGSIYPVSAS